MKRESEDLLMLINRARELRVLGRLVLRKNGRGIFNMPRFCFFMLVMRIFSYVFHCIRNSEWKPPTTGDERVGASSTPTPEPESTRRNAVCPIKSVVSIFGISLLLATFYNTVSYVTSRNGNRIAAESGRFGPARFWFRF